MRTWELAIDVAGLVVLFLGPLIALSTKDQGRRNRIVYWSLAVAAFFLLPALTIRLST
jgi:hypothetical protein